MDRGHLVTDEEDGSAVDGDVVHLAEALLLELLIADGQDLVDEEDLRLEVCRYGERQADVHAAGVPLHGRVEELRHTGELDDGIEGPIDLFAGHPENGTVQEDVLTPGELRMETCADLEQAADPAPEVDAAGRWGSDPRQELQQRALPRAVAPDDTQHLALLDFEAHLPKREELLLLVASERVASPVECHLRQRHVVCLLVTDRVRLAQPVDPHGEVR